MKTNTSRRTLTVVLSLAILLSLFASAVQAAPSALPSVPVTFSILHTNDFHGQLESSGSNPGAARVATIINDVRTAVGAANVLLVDIGDEMQGSLLSNLGDGTATGKGIPTIATYNAMGYNLATFGNHEFDWGQVNLANRTTEALYPYITANIVKNDTGNCATAGWVKPDYAVAPYQILTVGTVPNTVRVGFIAVTTTETPTITVSTATAGLCFKDPAESILHYYDEVKANADVMVVMSHLGYADGGYGYGLPVYGDQTLATKLITSGKPVNLIIGGHSHTDLTTATTVTVPNKVGTTKIVQAHYNGRKVGRADVTVGTDGSVNLTWASLKPYPSSSVTPPPTAEDATIKALITTYATNPAYVTLVNTPIGYSAVDLGRSNTTDNMMGSFIDDAIYNYLNTDAEPTNDIDIFFNNAGGIRADWCYDTLALKWINTGCVSGTHDPALLTYGNMFTVLPFGNATVVGRMTGAQILQVLHYGPNVAGVIQPAGLKYKYFSYKDGLPGPQPYAWGAFDVTVLDKASGTYLALDLKQTYNVGTNEFLAPAGGDGYSAFKYMTNITYWGDMLNAVNSYVSDEYGTSGTAYKGPNNDGSLNGRILRDGDNTTGSIIPLTVLHHNDSHGNLAKGTFVGYTQLATLIKQERLHNPNRTLLLSSGDNIQGDAMMYYFKTAPTGFASDGTPLAADLQMNPLIKVFNSMNYDAMTLGNHEFNFGSAVFTSVLGQATFPLLQANVADTGAYGLAAANILPFTEKIVNPGVDNINVAIMGIGNHRIPNYELPSNIPGLSFSDPLLKAQELSTQLRPTHDVVIALTHIGFTENAGSIEVDANVDTNLAKTVTGLDAIIGGHSHTDPSKQTAASGEYKFLPSIIADPDGKPVVTTQAYRFNSYLGEVVMGLRVKAGGGYEVVSQTGRYLAVVNAPTATAEDAAVKAIVDPYAAVLASYNNRVIGQTTTPIDTMDAFTAETNGANLQADAAVYKLETVHSIPVDFHLSGAMTNKLIAIGATPASPYSLKISDMFGAMPYENSLVVISMNGPQLKAVLERAYRNYYYYKYVPGYGGYSRYTTCMLDTNAGGEITYNDLYPALPGGDNVVALKINGTPIDFTNASKFYNVSTVNYLAAGSCNFNNSGVSLWPLNQIVQDTQYYVRDAVIDYITNEGTVSPAIEGRIKYAPAPEIQVLEGAVDIVDGTGSVDFGITNFGVPVYKTFTVKNTGTAPLNLSAPTLPAGFSLVSPFDATVLIDSSTTFQVKMDATAAGLPTGSLSFVNNDVDENPFDFTIHGQVNPVVSGNLGSLGATLTYTGSASGSAIVTGSDYAFVAPMGWTGTLTPAKRGFTFTPASIIISAPGVLGNLSGQNFTAAQNADTIGVYRSSTAFSYLRDINSTGPATVFQYGMLNDKPVYGDWDGNGSDTVGIFRNGVFYLRNSNDTGIADTKVLFGIPGDQPLAGDFNNDGSAEIGVYRNGVFYLRDRNIPGPAFVTTFALGSPGDVAIVGDWNGDGQDTVGIYRPSIGKFFLKDSNASGPVDYAFNYGLVGDKPVIGDWNGDGRDTIGIYRSGVFYLRNTNNAGFANIVQPFGMVSDTPLAGDWNGQ